MEVSHVTDRHFPKLISDPAADLDFGPVGEVEIHLRCHRPGCGVLALPGRRFLGPRTFWVPWL